MAKQENTPDNAAVHSFKAFKFELENVDESGEFSGYAAVFGNIDDGGDIIEKGAFSKTIKEDFSRIKILSQHDDSDLPIGKPIELREDDKGLYIRGKISDTQRGRDIRTLLKDGVLNELSIGYDALIFDIDAQGIRHLKEIRLWEISIVMWAMNDQAKIDEVKSMINALKLEAKAGKITQTRINALKPFIAVLRELVEILGPFLDPAAVQLPENNVVTTQNNIVKSASPVKQAKMSNVIFEIIP